MKKRLKMILALAICAAILLPSLVACGWGNGGGEITYGRYVEEDISPEGMKGYPQTFVSLGNNVLELVTVDWSGDIPVYYRWRSADSGNTWQAQDMSWTEEYIHDYSEYYEKGTTPPEEINLGNIIPCENGEVLFMVYTFTMNEDYGTSTTEAFRLKLDGTIEPFVLPEMEKLEEQYGNISIGNMQALPGNRLFISMQSNPQPPDYIGEWREFCAVYDLTTGEKLYDLQGESVWQVAYNSHSIFVFDYQTNAYVAYNIEDGTPSTAPMPSQEVIQGMGGAMMMGPGGTVVDNDNNFYSVSARGMEKAAPDATEKEMIMDGLNYTFGSPLCNVSNALYDVEKNVLLLSVAESGGLQGVEEPGQILRYVWDEKAIATSDKKIQVYSLYENYSVRLALSQFKRQNPEVTLEYDFAFGAETMWGAMPFSEAEGNSNSNAMTEEDALRALNTELLNGTGPDVLILDNMPIESFITKGVLEDITSLVEENQDLYQSLFQPLYHEGKLYAAPTSFYAPALFGDRGYVEQFTDLDTLVSAIKNGADLPEFKEMDPSWTMEEQNAYYEELFAPKAPEDQPVLRFSSLDELFASFYASSAPAVFAEQSGVDRNQLATFLTAVKDVSDKYGFASPDQMRDYGGGGSMSIGGYAMFEYSATVDSYGSRQSRLGYSRLGSLQDLASLSWSSYYNANPDRMGRRSVMVDENGNMIEMEEAPDAGETEEPTEVLPPLDMMVISAPGLRQGVYHPTLIAGVTSTSNQPELARAFVSTMLHQDVQKHDLGNGFPVSREAFRLQYESYLSQGDNMNEEGFSMLPFDYEKFIGGLQTPFYANDFLRSSVYKPVQEFCGGRRSLDEATNQIVRETELYFAERQ